MTEMPRQILIWCCCLLLVQLVTALTGDNVCKRIETSSETVEYVVTEPVTFRVYTWCLKMPPRCSKYMSTTKERIKTKLQMNNHTIDFCCDGYVQLETYCVPECNRTDCPNMRCDSDKICICEAGFEGQRCHRQCRRGFWGKNCANKCVCNGEPCNLISGDCMPIITTVVSFMSSSGPPEHNSPSNEFKDYSNTFVTPSLNSNKQIPHLPTIPTFTTQQISNTKSKNKKTDLYQDILQQQESDLDATVMPDGMSLDDIQTTLLPEDEVMIVYPSEKTKLYTSTQKSNRKNLYKTTQIPPVTTVSVKQISQKYLVPSEITKPPYNPERNQKPTATKIHQTNIDKNKLFDLLPTTDQTKSTTGDSIKLNKAQISTNKMNSNKKYYASTDLPNNKNVKYHIENTLPRKGNGLPPPVPDGSDNSLRIRNRVNDVKNITSAEENENNNNNILKSNELQRDMEETNTSNNYSRANFDTTVNSSLVRAKWNSALDAIDFGSPSIIITTTITIILFLVLVVTMILHCTKKSKMESPSFYDANVKTCHDNGAVCNGHYASPGGQPIFFCPAFTNTYAFELAQAELREAHYDHPRSARCLANEPVYAELQY